MFLHELDWERYEQPVLSAMTTQQDWCRVTLYSPSVVRTEQGYRMWYCGNRTATRTNEMDLGVAESEDGILWTPSPANPILSSADLPWGGAWQTPHVLFDSAAGCFRMWFVMANSERDSENRLLSFGQKLGYAVSPDGLDWDVHPEPALPSARGPCVLNADDGSYEMWTNTSPSTGGEFRDLVSGIYRSTSPDGLNWTRDPDPAVRTTDTLRSVVYPFVIKSGVEYTVWYGCHVDGGVFEIYCSTSPDGRTWTHHHDKPSFPASHDPNRFDGRYTSTPCVLEEPDRYLLYYSARDWGNFYGAGDGSVQFDADGIYRHIGLAIAYK